MTCKERLESYFGANGVAFEEATHTTAFTAQEVAQSEHVSGHHVAKAVIGRAGGQFIMLVMPASHRVDLLKLGAVLGLPVELAKESEFSHVFPDCEVGAMPPFGNLYGLPVYVDKSMVETRWMILQAGTHSETIRISYADYARLVQPTVAEFTRVV